MKEEKLYFKSDERPSGKLDHKPTHTTIYVYGNIGWFKRLMIKWCFGLEYQSLKCKTEKEWGK